MEESVAIKAIYNPDEKLFNLDVGPAHLKLDPLQFGRMIEYLDTVWSSYSEWKKSGGAK